MSAPYAIYYSSPHMTFEPSIHLSTDTKVDHSISIPSDEPWIWYTAYTSPLFNGSYAVFGDSTKWVPMSGQRVRAVLEDDRGLTIELVGTAGEQVPITSVEFTGSGKISVTTCVIDRTGSAFWHLDYVSAALSCSPNHQKEARNSPSISID